MLIHVEGLTKVFLSGLLRKKRTIAVNAVSFGIKPGETLGLVGESGSGKSTIAKLMVRLIAPSSGKIYFQSQEITRKKHAELKQIRAAMQIIFQHPESALNPRMSIYDSLVEPLRLQKLVQNRRLELKRAYELIELVGLHVEHLNRYPHELSGGQIQRVVLVRILSLQPQCIIADEPTSMLDVSVQAQMLNLFKSIQEQFGIAYLFISHDLDVVRWMSDYMMILYRGHIVEKGRAEYVYNNPKHPYTRRLIDAYHASAESKENIEERSDGEPENSFNSCPFYDRCHHADSACMNRPTLEEKEPEHYVACWHT